jgi:soluble lytic murein transglycosylase
MWMWVMMQWPESGRYQKLVRLDAAKVLRACLPILALFTAACALVDAQQREMGANGEAGAFSPHAEQAPAFPLNHPPLVMDGLPLTVQTPALMAVIASREAITRKQWPALGMLVAQAKPDPLGMYPEYWLLRSQLWNGPAQRPVGDLQRFLSANVDTYLADKLRGD